MLLASTSLSGHPEQRKFTPDMKEFNPIWASAYASLAQHCSYRERSAAELSQKMERMELDPEWREPLLKKLQDDGFQSDSRYARAYTRDKYSLEQWGRIRIRQQLHQKGISEELIEEAFQGIDQELYLANLRRLTRRHAAGLKGLAPNELRGRIFRFVHGKGYEHELIHQQIRELESGSTED